MQLYLIIMLCCPSAPPPTSVGKTHQTKGYFFSAKASKASKSTLSLGVLFTILLSNAVCT